MRCCKEDGKESNYMDVISLFDGMGCLYMALKEEGIIFDKYYASEIEKKPIEFTKSNFPDMVHVGDVTAWRDWDIDWSKVGLIGAGSPCQGFSFAGKMLNFDDPRSALFFVFVDILEHARKFNPDVKLLLENVNMKKDHQYVINDTVGLLPVRINSNLVSAQNRDRLYWSNIKTVERGLFGDIATAIPQPEDRGILLKDVLEDDIDEKYYLKKDVDLSHLGLDRDFIKLDKKLNEKLDQNKSACFTAGGNSGGNHSDMDLICVSMIGRKLDENGVRKDYDPNIKAVQRLEPNLHNKTNCLTSVQKDNLIIQRPHGFNKGGIFKEKSPTILSNSWEHNNHIYNGYRVRRLTPTECFRLQTIPEWVSMEGFSDTALYKMAGNGWTVEVIRHILKHMK